MEAAASGDQPILALIEEADEALAARPPGGVGTARPSDHECEGG